jgi:hypothetical protein
MPKAIPMVFSDGVVTAPMPEVGMSACRNPQLSTRVFANWLRVVKVGGEGSAGLDAGPHGPATRRDGTE